MAITGKLIIFAAIIAITAATKFGDAKDKALGIFSKKTDVGWHPEPEKQMDSMSDKNEDEDDDGSAKIRIKAIIKGVLLMLAKLFKLIDKVGGGLGGSKDNNMELDSWGNPKFSGLGSHMFGKSSFDPKDFGSKIGIPDGFGILGVLKDYFKRRLLKKD